MMGRGRPSLSPEIPPQGEDRHPGTLKMPASGLPWPALSHSLQRRGRRWKGEQPGSGSWAAHLLSSHARSGASLGAPPCISPPQLG